MLEFAKRFARSGFYVFPTFDTNSSKNLKPYGWTGKKPSEDKAHLAIPATCDEAEIDKWDEQVRRMYKGTLSGYGILGKGIIIIDIDVKDGKPGVDSYSKLVRDMELPPTSLMVRTKSGGAHIFYKRPKKYMMTHVKSLTSLKIRNETYEGIDIRGDGGFVQGATAIGEWVEGVYTIVRGSPEVKLTEAPEDFTKFLVGGNISNDDIDAMTAFYKDKEPDDLQAKLRRGELPDVVPNGVRNESFFIFLTALKGKGIDREIAKNLALQLADRCEDPHTLHESVNIDGMLDRIFEKTTDNPYDIGLDLVERGLTLLMNHRSKLTYVMLDDNPYILSKNPHDIGSMRELLSKYAKLMTLPDGRSKIVNPIDVAIRRIPDHQKADTLGFKPGAPTVFRHGDDNSGTRFLNLYQAPEIHVKPEDVDDTIFAEFQLLISRIFGPEGSDEYQLGLDFCAWLIQYPQLKIVIAPYIMSKRRGVGKSLFLSLLTRILGTNRSGERQAKIVKLTDIAGRFFNPTGVLLNIIDEVQFSVHRNMRQESSEFWRSLKDIVTGDTFPIEIKNGGFFNVPNTAALILAGNKNSNFPIEESDRRIWIIDNAPPELERGTVDRLFEITKRTGIAQGSEDRNRWTESIRWHLQRHDIKLALDSIRAPMNDIKEEMLKATMTDFEEWLYDYFNDEVNLLAETPIITKSAFIYVMAVSEQVPNERWREEADSLFRDARRKGHIQPVKNNRGATLQFTNIPIVSRNGELVISDRKEQVFTVRDHGQFDHKTMDQVRQALFRNLQSINKWRSGQKHKAIKVISDVKDLEKYA